MNLLTALSFGHGYVYLPSPLLLTINFCAFHFQIRLVKFVLLLDFIAILILQTISLGWSVTTLGAKDAIIPTLNSFTALYLIVVTISTLNADIPDVHFTQVVHIGIITAITTLVFGSIAILPSSEITISGQPGSAVSWGLHYAVVGLYAVACIITINIPRGPPMHFPPEQIYSEKTVASITSRYKDNVCGIVNDSILGILFFSYTTKVPRYVIKYNQCCLPGQSRLLRSVIPRKALKSATCPSCRLTCVPPTCSEG